VSAGYDVAIIGAGDTGAAMARELARFELRVALLDAGDVGAGTSKANTAILHTGFDAKPGTEEARLVARGHDLLLAYADEVGIPIERTGALLVAWNDAELARLPEIEANAIACGYRQTRHLGPEELRRREPHLGAGALGALEVPGEYIVCPWTPPLAFATQAALAGVDVRRWERVTGLEAREDGWEITTQTGRLDARWVVNAAGLYSDELDRMAGYDAFTITPRRGELLVFDKLARPLVSHILLPVPTGRTKGVLIAPTVFGNVMLGPTADDISDKAATGSTPEGIARLRELGARLMPELLAHETTAIYAGLRAASEHSDYVLRCDAQRRYALAGGIRSTGLTASMALAEWLRDSLEQAGVALRERPGGLPPLRMPNLGEAGLRPHADAARIAADPAYGEPVCFCERVTRGELRDALASTLPPRDLDGLRRRTRVLMGRCQGFYCGAPVAATVAAAAGEPAAPDAARAARSAIV
jgi:glycerol-3-phosphate dehydrogenase